MLPHSHYSHHIFHWLMWNAMKPIGERSDPINPIASPDNTIT